MTARETAALHYLMSANQAASLEELNQVTVKCVAEFGFEKFACALVGSPGRLIIPKGLFGVGTADWGDAYAAERCAEVDPSIPKVFTNGGAFTWTDLRGSISAKQERVFRLAADFGMQDALVKPILGHHGGVAAVLFLSRRQRQIEEPDRSLLSAVATVYASAGMSLLSLPLSLVHPPLSRRERQCLAWVALGKSDGLMGEIMQLSSKTVRMHVENARKKLGANSRQQAVIEAWRRGWLVDAGE